jgi:two-component system, NarL family, sensor histidine kinase UhpB
MRAMKGLGVNSDMTDLLAIPLLIVSLLLFGLTWVMSRSRDRAIVLANRMSADLRETEQRYTGIFHSAMDAIITIDEKQEIVLFNPAAEKVFLCTAAQAIGAPLSRFMPQRFRELHHLHVERFGSKGVSDRRVGNQLEIFGLRADGEEFPMEASISQLLQHGKKFYTVMLRDITTSDQARVELKRSHAELRQLTAAMETTLEEERKRIARELHDDLGQNLTVLKMELSNVRKKLKTTPALDSAREILLKDIERMDAVLTYTVHSARRISANLRPMLLDHLGLEEALDDLSKQILRSSTIHYSQHIDVDCALIEERLTMPLYRIAQEALNNIVKHAEATEVALNLCRDVAGNLTLEIRDNGKGIQPADRRKTASFGLIGMRERVYALGGELLVESQLGVGTTIRVVISGVARDAPIPQDSLVPTTATL